MPDVRKAYIFAPRPGGVGGNMPYVQVERDALTIVEVWNRCIPINKVRVVTSLRFSDLRAALAVFPVAEIVTAIKFYGKQSWQRAKKAWMTFDHFIQVNRLTGWVEQSQEAAELTNRRPATGPAAGLIRTITKARQAGYGYKIRGDSFDRLTAARRKELLGRSRDELRLRLGGREPNIFLVNRRALELMEDAALS